MVTDDLWGRRFHFYLNVKGFDHAYAATRADEAMKRKNRHAVALGRKGGLAGKGKTSAAKAAAARENGKKGGRPKRS